MPQEQVRADGLALPVGKCLQNWRGRGIQGEDPVAGFICYFPILGYRDSGPISGGQAAAGVSDFQVVAEPLGCALDYSHPFGLWLCGCGRVTAVGSRRRLLAGLIAPLAVPLRCGFSFLFLRVESGGCGQGWGFDPLGYELCCSLGRGPSWECCQPRNQLHARPQGDGAGDWVTSDPPTLSVAFHIPWILPTS